MTLNFLRHLINNLINRVDALEENGGGGGGGGGTGTLASLYGNNLATAIAAIGSTPTTLIAAENFSVTSDLTIPVNLQLQMVNGAVMTISSGATVTFNSAFDLGNVRCFNGDGDIIFDNGANYIYRTAWWTGPNDDQAIDTAMTKALIAATAMTGITIQVPNGNWFVNTPINLPNGTTLKGEGGGGFNYLGTIAFGTNLTAGTAGINMFTFIRPVASFVTNLTFEGFCADGANLANVIGFKFSNPAGMYGVAGILFNDVTVGNCRIGVDFERTDVWGQYSEIHFDHRCRLWQNTVAGMRLAAEDTIIDFAGMIQIYGSSASVGILIEGYGCGVLTLNSVFIGGNYTVPGTRQVITQTVVAPSGITSGGIARCVVTHPSLPGGMKTVSFPVTTAHNTANKIAFQAARALAGDIEVAKLFHIGYYDEVLDASFKLSMLDVGANEPTFNMTIENVTSAGITNDLVAVQEIAGVASVDRAGCGIRITGAPKFLQLINVWFESILSAIEIDIVTVYGYASTNINITGGQIGDPIRVVNGYGGNLNIVGAGMAAKTVRFSATPNMMVNIIGQSAPFVTENLSYERVFVNRSPYDVPTTLGFGGWYRATDRQLFDNTEHMSVNGRFDVINNKRTAATLDRAWVRFAAANDDGAITPNLELGTMDAALSTFVGYQFGRNNTDGLLEISSTHPLLFNGMRVGNIDVTNDVNVGSVLKLGTTPNMSSMRSLGSGVVLLLNEAASSFDRIIFGGIAATDPSLRRVGSGLEVQPANVAGGRLDFAARNGVFDDTVTAAALNLGGTTLLDVLSATGVLDFDLTSVASQDLTIPLVGAALGDSVALGIPHGSATADTVFMAWVSAVSNVTVRAMRLAGTPNPVSGTFRVTILKFA